MHVVRQDADRDRLEGKTLLDGRVDMPQMTDMAHEEIARPVGESDGEEEDTALDPGSNIARHDASLSYSCRASSNQCLWWAKAHHARYQDEPQSNAPLPTLRNYGTPFCPAALLDRLEYAVGRHRQIVEPYADGVGEGIGERGQERGERALAGFLGAERTMRIVALDDADLDRRRVPDGRHPVVEHVGHHHEAVVVGGLP